MKKTLALVIIISLATMNSYIVFEPEIVKGEATSTALTTVSLTVTAEININCTSTVTLSPNIAGQTGGTATNTFGCVVETNNVTGYNLKIKKNQKLQIADAVNQRFDDYTTSSAATDWNWDTVPAGAEEFGLAINSCASTTDVVQKFRDNGTSACATGTSVTAWRCWHPIPTTPTEETVINRGTATPAGGILTTFGLEAQAGGSNNLQQGTYNCTTTATATTN